MSTIAPVAERKLPWTWPWWHVREGQFVVLFWIVLIHITAAIGLILYPWPGWPIFLTAATLTWLGGLGTTVCYHRTLAHRSLQLHPVVRELLIFFAMFNGSGEPRSWTANHRLHHANADSIADVSSPRIGGFWWAHLRWLWQATPASPQRYCPELTIGTYRVWTLLHIPLVAVSYLCGGAIGAAAFFWLGAIRLVFALHGQAFVNSVCHLGVGGQPGDDSSKNVYWLGLWHLFQGENWHHNHHARPGSARLGCTPRQVDVGWWVIVGLERLGLATEVRRPRHLEESSGEVLQH